MGCLQHRYQSSTARKLENASIEHDRKTNCIKISSLSNHIKLTPGTLNWLYVALSRVQQRNLGHRFILSTASFNRVSALCNLYWLNVGWNCVPCASAHAHQAKCQKNAKWNYTIYFVAISSSTRQNLTPTRSRHNSDGSRFYSDKTRFPLDRHYIQSWISQIRSAINKCEIGEISNYCFLIKLIFYSLKLMLDSNALRDFHPFFILQQKARKCLTKRWTWTLWMLNETVGRKKCYIIPAPVTTQFWGQIEYIVHIPKFFFC